MKHFIIVWITMAILIVPSFACSQTVLNLVDISGSLAEAKGLFKKNMEVMKHQIERNDKNDRFKILAFRSHGEPWSVVDFKFPPRRGGRNRTINQAQKKLKKLIHHNFSKPSIDINQMGGSTDIVGAINHSLLWLGDQSDPNNPVELSLYSDGLQTAGMASLFNLKRVTSYRVRKKKAADYLRSLENKLSNIHLVTPPRLDKLLWYGAIHGDDLGLYSGDLSALEAQLRHIWITFLKRELPETKIQYLLKY